MMNTNDRWERVRQLFQAALEQPGESREAFLAARCNGDPELHREVSSLLAAHAASGGFLETPAMRLDDHLLPGAWSGLQAGDRIGHFEVVAPLGAGGMGEVYRAHDAQLGRQVAIKLLPPAFAADPERLARFERESRILASLNHPNIASIHSVEEVGGLRVLVLELVEGPTLADHLKAGRVPVPDALSIARQLADALEAAHERGIVHRDVKPANVKIGPSGRVMLLDFGLAKERTPFDTGRPGHDTGGSTNAGTILGTCAYMSPEQARGQSVDKRTDIWAFGCILFELLTEGRAFQGDTPSDTIAAVLGRQPDWSRLPDTLPTRLHSLLRRCLEKDPHRRLHDIADARIEIDDVLQQAPESIGGQSAWARVRFGAATLAAIAALTVGSLALGWWMRGALSTGAPSPPATRTTWPLPAGLHLQSPAAVSPDGRFIAFAASADATPPQLYVRALSGFDVRAVPRTEGATQPFWSPDSRALGYFARGQLMKVAVDGGAPVVICAADNPRGGAWGSKNVIVFAPGSIYKGLVRVSADGGNPQPATLLDATKGENSHRWPAFLPDGTQFVYFVRALVAERRGVYLGRTDRPASVPGAALFRSESEAVYAPTEDPDRGVFLSVADGHIEVHRFDRRRQALTGGPTIITLPAGGNTPHHASMLSVSANVLTHVASSLPFGQRLASSTRSGEAQPLDAEPGIVNWPRLSPDGTRLVTQRLDALTGSPDLWVEHLERGTRVRVTEPGTSGQLPVWSPDGTRLAYVAGSFEKPVVTIAASDGTGVIATLPCPRFRCEPSDWSADGRWLLVTALEGAAADVWMLSTTGGAPRPLLTESFVEREARFSPDGRFVTYVSEETGRPEISVRTVDGVPRREVVSVGGGTQPVWRRDGTEILFVDPAGSLRSAAVRRMPDGRPAVGAGVRVNVPAIGTGHYGTQYDLSPDGRRVYFLNGVLAEGPHEIGVVLGWRELVK